jgi:hypothetical protein
MMMVIDLTNELAPLIWTLEGLMLVSVAWLVAMFFAEQLRPTNFHAPKVITTLSPDPTKPGRPKEHPADDDRRMAA